MSLLVLANDGVFPVTKDSNGNLLNNTPATGLKIPGTIQGEGKLAGTPSLFIRLASCNLRCIWRLPNGKLSVCDTPYASFNALKNKQSEVNDVVNLVLQNLGSINHIVITGGEPLIQKPALAKLVALLKTKTNAHLTLETNGTLYDEDVAKNIDLFSISPKLENSNPNFHKIEVLGLNPSGPIIFHGEKRINIEALQSFIDIRNRLNKELQLKFVIANPDEETEIEVNILNHLNGWVPDDILLMPLGANREELAQTSKIALEMAIIKGWRYSPRIHIDLFGSKIGV